MKNKGFEITLILGIIVFSIILYGGYLIHNLYLQSKSYTLFLKPYSVFECKKWDCKDLSSNLDNYNNKDYNIFIDGTNVGINEILYNNINKRYFVFNKNNESIYKEGNLFGYTGKAKISGIKYIEDELTREEITEIKNKNNLNFDINDVMYSNKIVLDFDNDNKNENLYIISSGLDVIDAIIYFDYVIYEDNGKFYKLIESNSEKGNYEKIGHSEISTILDIFDDKKLEIITYTEYSLTGDSCSVIYRLKGKKFVPVNKCEIVK